MPTPGVAAKVNTTSRADRRPKRAQGDQLPEPGGQHHVIREALITSQIMSGLHDTQVVIDQISAHAMYLIPVDLVQFFPSQWQRSAIVLYETVPSCRDFIDTEK